MGLRFVGGSPIGVFFSGDFIGGFFDGGSFFFAGLAVLEMSAIGICRMLNPHTQVLIAETDETARSGVVSLAPALTLQDS
ncbi:MAG TPA: hypothetical protein VFK65_15360 [Candidatus Binatia bacterium]|nr:hypothetical protein [Candidatus Binatia bacterium]